MQRCFATVAGIKDFLQSALKDDALNDWQLAKDLGELLVRINPEELLGHALLSRACTHLGHKAQAADELVECRNLLVYTNNPAAGELFGSFLAHEEKHR